MALNKVAAEAGIGPESPLEIDRIAWPEMAQVGSDECFLEKVKDELVPAMRCESEAAPIDGEAIADVNVPVDSRGHDDELGAGGGLPDPKTFAHFFDKAGKHQRGALGEVENGWVGDMAIFSWLR